MNGNLFILIQALYKLLAYSSLPTIGKVHKVMQHHDWRDAPYIAYLGGFNAK